MPRTSNPRATARRCVDPSGRPRALSDARADSSERFDANESADAAEAAEPIESTEQAEPTCHRLPRPLPK
jgi:hypothetical protein